LHTPAKAGVSLKVVIQCELRTCRSRCLQRRSRLRAIAPTYQNTIYSMHTPANILHTPAKAGVSLQATIHCEIPAEIAKRYTSYKPNTSSQHAQT